MNWFRGLLLALTLFYFLTGQTSRVQACPSCADAVPESTGAEEEDRAREGQAYNSSIYLMVSVPYLLLGSVGFLVYRGLKRRSLVEQLASTSGQSDGERRPACSTLSRVEVS